MSAYVLERKLEGALRSVSKTDFCKASEPRSTIVFVCEESLILKFLTALTEFGGAMISQDFVFSFQARLN